jgi:hypothetical protein
VVLPTLPDTLWLWLAIAGLGLFHGINPAMGWLFAVALGLNRRSERVVWLALLPIGLGHALAVAVACRQTSRSAPQLMCSMPVDAYSKKLLTFTPDLMSALQRPHNADQRLIRTQFQRDSGVAPTAVVQRVVFQGIRAGGTDVA